MKNKIYKLSIVMAMLLQSGLAAVTVGVSQFKVHDTGLNSDVAADFFQNEIGKNKALAIRDRQAVSTILTNMTDCASGVVKCDNSGVQLQKLDVIVFGEINKHPDGFLVNVRAVRESTWSVIHSESQSGDNAEKIMGKLADRLGAEIANSARNAEDKSTADGKYYIAVYSIRNANAAAQGERVTEMINSVIVSAFDKGGKFQIVERARFQDMMDEKALNLSGLVQADGEKFAARGITHYFTGSLKVQDSVRILSYSIINVKTGMPIVSDVIEWDDDTQLMDAMEQVSVDSEKQVFKVNGRLMVKECDMNNVSVLLEESAKGARVTKLGTCPLTVEDIPKGKYNLIFSNPERDSLTMAIEIKPQETFVLEKVSMPEVDMTLFTEANTAERSGKYAEAVEKFRAFYQKYPRFHLAVYAMYREGYITQIHLKKLAEGRRILEEVIRRNPTMADVRTEAYYGMALGFQNEGNSARSVELLKMLTNEYPSSTAALQAQGCLNNGGTCSF